MALEEKDFRQRSWNHIFWLFDNGFNELYINSKKIKEFSYSILEESIFAFYKQETVFGSAFIFGQEQDTLGGTFSEKQIYQGYITEFNIWDHTLSGDQRDDLFQCSDFPKGNLFSWEEKNLKTFGNATLKPVTNMKELCRKKLLFLFSNKISLLNSMNICSSLGGRIVLPQNQNENDDVMKFFEVHQEKCIDRSNIALWIGLEKNPGSKDWSTVGNISDVKGIPFTPNNSFISSYNDSHNCIYMMNNGGWKSFQGCNHATNSLSACTICEFSHVPMITIKGFCISQKSPDWVYYLSRSRSVGQDFLFEGYKRDMLWKSGNSWKLNQRSGSLFGSMSDIGQVGPIGRHPWSMTDFGRSICSPPLKHIVPLTFSVCNSKQFTCDSGHCINVYQRCDDFVDCKDGSDESECEVVKVPENYKKEPPPLKDNTINYITTNVTIVKFDNIDKSGVVDITLTIEMMWKDPRLTYLNIMDEGQTEGGYEKDISVETQDKLWLPLNNIVQTNAVIGEVHEEAITFVRVIVGDNATAPSNEYAIEGLTYLLAY